MNRIEKSNSEIILRTHIAALIYDLATVHLHKPASFASKELNSLIFSLLNIVHEL